MNNINNIFPGEIMAFISSKPPLNTRKFKDEIEGEINPFLDTFTPQSRKRGC